MRLAGLRAKETRINSAKGQGSSGSSLLLWYEICLTDTHLVMSNSSIRWNWWHLAQAARKVIQPALSNPLGVAYNSSVPAPGLQSSIIGNSSVNATTSMY